MAQSPLPPENRDGFRIAIICALLLEADMVEFVLDRHDIGKSYNKVEGDTNVYTTGAIGAHNVVLAYMPGMGGNNAAAVVSGLRVSFPRIQVAFIVGICGTIPVHRHTKQEVILGDCIYGTAVVQYDLGRQFPQGFVTKNTVEDSLAKVSPEIRSLAAMLQTQRNQQDLTQRLVYHLEILQRRRPDSRYPGAELDRLFEPSYDHRGCPGGSTCDECLADVGICSKSCHIVGCDGRVIDRQRLQTPSNSLHDSVDTVRLDTTPLIHFGRFGSANTVMKSGLDRDRIANKADLLAFEMEGSGACDFLPTIVIKSACDYADSHKNKKWQPYAAATAAAGLKAVLERWEVTESLTSQESKYDVPFSLQGIPVSKKFVDRPAEMQSMEKILLPRSSVPAERRIFVLHGLGGIGKTQLAVTFMRSHKASFSAVFWLDGSSKDSLESSMAACAVRIPVDQISEASRNYTSSEKGDRAAVVREVLQWFSRTGNERWLMIIDNVDRAWSPSTSDLLAYDVKAYLPAADHGSILITSRLVRLGQIGESCEVKKIEIEKARAVLKVWYRKSYGKVRSAKSSHVLEQYRQLTLPIDPVEGDRLLEHLDGLPLAIAQAGAFLQESGMDMANYLRLYEQQQEEVARFLQGTDAPLEDYPSRSVWTTWNVSYDAILNRDSHTANLLVLWSFLDRNDLWYEVFERSSRACSAVAEQLSEWVGNIASSELSFSAAMHLLRSYSLIEGSGGGYSIHAVVYRWAYFYKGIRHVADIETLALKVVGFAVPANTERDYARLQRRLLPHAQICSSRMLVEDLGQAQNGNESDRAHRPDSLGRDKDLLSAMHLLGYLYDDQGKLDEAEKMLLRALQGREALGAEHTSTLSTVNNLGGLYMEQGRLEEAEKMLLRALQGREALGAEHTSTLSTVNNLGGLYMEQGRLEEAEKMLLRALRGSEASGAEHLSTLNPVNNLGILYRHQGRLDEAEKMFLRALQGKEKALGAKHTSTLNTVGHLGSLYRNQGNLYSDQGKLDEAEKMYVRALRGYEEAVGSELIQTYLPALNTMYNLGYLYSMAPSKITECREMYTKALSGYTKVRGASSKESIDLQRRLATLDVGAAQPKDTSSELSINSAEPELVDENKALRRGGRIKTLIRKLKKTSVT